MARIPKSLTASIAAIGLLAGGGAVVANAGSSTVVPAAGNQAAQATSALADAAKGEAATENAPESTTESTKGETGGESTAPESATDTAGQAAACKTAGVDPNGSNVNYDEATGTCNTAGDTADSQSGETAGEQANN